MEKYIVEDIDLAISENELLKTLRITEDPDDEDYQTVVRMLREALACAKPKYVYCIAAIEEKGSDTVVVEGHRFVSALMRKNLDQVHRIVPYVATCGTEVENWSRQYTDMLEHFWADEIKKLILHKCIAAMRKKIKAQYFTASDLSQMSPGSLPEWPITAQPALFDLIGRVNEATGVELTDSCLMLPSKSISGFFFSSATHYENCQHCPMPNCPNRRAGQILPDQH